MHIVVSEWFKIKDGYISHLEAFFDGKLETGSDIRPTDNYKVTGQSTSGWPSFENYTVLSL